MIRIYLVSTRGLLRDDSHYGDRTASAKTAKLKERIHEAESEEKLGGSRSS